tara:strand:+ start:193 stop:816 length:624 start_codon:yes stop_codon:yes gene_type:complete
MILDPIDQNIRNQGFNFVPFDRTLAERFQPNTLDMSGSGLSSFGTPGSIPTGRFGIVNPNINVGPNVPFGGEDEDEEELNLNRTDNLGINSFTDLTQSGFFGSPTSIGFNLFGIPGALLGTLGAKALDNYNNQYTDIFGNLNKQTKDAILEDYRDSPEGIESAKDYADLQQEIGQTRDAPGGDGGNNSGGGLDSGGREGYGGGGQYQ